MRLLLLLSALFFTACASFTPMSEITPEQAERLRYLKTTFAEAKQEGALTRTDQLQMNNASAVQRAH